MIRPAAAIRSHHVTSNWYRASFFSYALRVTGGMALVLGGLLDCDGKGRSGLILAEDLAVAELPAYEKAPG